MAQRIDDSFDALLSQNSGATAPSYAVEGTFWADTSSAGFVTLRIYDGADWTPVLVLNKSTNTVRFVSVNPEVQIASAATVAIGAAASENIEITGATAITAFDSVAAGTVRRLRFAASLTLTHNATSMISPTGANIVVQPGDVCFVASNGAGNWRIVAHVPAVVRVGLVATRSVTSASSPTDRTFGAADAGRLVSLGGSSDFTMTFAPAADLGNGWAVDVIVSDSVVVTLDPNSSETIDGVATMPLHRGQRARLVCDGSSIQIAGLVNLWRHETLLGATASSVEAAIPPGLRRFLFDLRWQPTAAGAQLLMQFSNNGGSTWQTTGYVGANVYAGTGATLAAQAGPTNGLYVGSGDTAYWNFGNGDLFLGPGLAENRVNNNFFGFFLAQSFHYSSSASLNSSFSGVNRIRFIPSTGSIASGSRFILQAVE